LSVSAMVGFDMPFFIFSVQKKINFFLKKGVDNH